MHLHATGFDLTRVTRGSTDKVFARAGHPWFGPTFNQYLKLLSPTSCLSLPENVKFAIVVKNGDPIDLSSLQTFPIIKSFSVEFSLENAITVELLHHFSTVAKCFPNLETAQLDLDYHHDFDTHSIAKIVSAKEQLCNLSFPVPVDVYHYEKMFCNYPQTPESFYGRLESIGFEQTYAEGLDAFEFDTENDNVKLKYELNFTDYDF